MPDTCVRGFLHVLIAYSFMPEFVRPPPPEEEWKTMPLRFLSEIFLFFTFLIFFKQICFYACGFNKNS